MPVEDRTPTLTTFAVRWKCGHTDSTAAFVVDDDAIKATQKWYGSLNCSECDMKQLAEEITRRVRSGRQKGN